MLKEWHNRKVFCKSFFRFVLKGFELDAIPACTFGSLFFAGTCFAVFALRPDVFSPLFFDFFEPLFSSFFNVVIVPVSSSPKAVKENVRPLGKILPRLAVRRKDSSAGRNRPCLHRVADKAIANCSRQCRGWTERVFERTIKRFSPIICKFLRPAGAELSHLWRDQ